MSHRWTLPLSIALSLSCQRESEAQQGPLSLGSRRILPGEGRQTNPHVEWTGADFLVAWEEREVVAVSISPEGRMDGEPARVSIPECTSIEDMACDGANRCALACSSYGQMTDVNTLQVVLLEEGAVLWLHVIRRANRADAAGIVTANVEWVNGEIVVATDGPDSFRVIYIDPSAPEAARTVTVWEYRDTPRSGFWADCTPLADGDGVFAVCVTFGTIALPVIGVSISPEGVAGEPSELGYGVRCLVTVPVADSWLAAWTDFYSPYRLHVGRLAPDGLVELSRLSSNVPCSEMTRHGDGVALAFAQADDTLMPPTEIWLTDVSGSEPTDLLSVTTNGSDATEARTFDVASAAGSDALAVVAETQIDNEVRVGLWIGHGALVRRSLPCTSKEQCASGFCADSVCCDSACGDPCEACDVVGQVGSCELQRIGGACPERQRVIGGGCHAGDASSQACVGPAALIIVLATAAGRLMTRVSPRKRGMTPDRCRRMPPQDT